MSILSTFPTPFTRFIETGTGRGETLALASKTYKECLSIEVDYEKYLEASKVFLNTPSIRLYYGHSSFLLQKLIDPSVPTFFWLDAHYVSNEVGMVKGYGNCPLLSELEEINKVEWAVQPLIYIDDFSTFERGLYSWPTLQQLDEVMKKWERSQISDEIFSYRKV